MADGLTLGVAAGDVKKLKEAGFYSVESVAYASRRELADERVCEGEGDACGRYDGWRFGSVRHLNEPAGGTWRLRVTDAQPQDTGVWQTWRLTIWGR